MRWSCRVEGWVRWLGVRVGRDGRVEWGWGEVIVWVVEGGGGSGVGLFGGLLGEETGAMFVVLKMAGGGGGSACLPILTLIYILLLSSM